MSDSKPHKIYHTLDGLRGVAAICVVLFHGKFAFGGPGLLQHAGLAVDFFFALSGFVLALAYEDRLRQKTLKPGKFFILRVIRLYPLIFIASLIALVAALLDPSEAGATSSFHLIYYFLLALLALPRIHAGGHSGAISPLNGPEWSLTFEMAVSVFYGCAAKFLTNKLVYIIIGVSAALTIYQTYRTGAINSGHGVDQFVWGYPRTAFSFFTGVLLYRFRHSLPKWNVPVPLICGLLVASFLPNSGIRYQPVYDLFCVGILYPLILVFGIAHQPLPGTQSIMKFSGLLSYPLYILHYPIFLLVGIMTTQLHASKHGYAMALFSLGLSAIVSFIIAQYYDIPMRRKLAALIKAKTPPGQITD